MNIDELKSRRQSLILSSNREWAEILNLRALVRSEFNARGCMSAGTFNAVIDWKLRKQRGQTEKHRVRNSAELIEELTGAFWRVKHEEKDKLMDIRLSILMAIPGVGVGVASAILAICYPEDCAVIDRGSWKVLYRERKWQFTQSDYKKYISDMRRLAGRLGCDVQEVDYVLWKANEEHRPVG
jgi:thermostable 8-oxoguanine DNA glycosylase